MTILTFPRLTVAAGAKFSRCVKPTPGAARPPFLKKILSIVENYSRKPTTFFWPLLNCGVHKMAPIYQTSEEAVAKIDKLVNSNKVLIFSKSYCPYCNKVKGLFDELQEKYFSLELDSINADDSVKLQEALKMKTKQSTVPSVFIHGKHIGGCDMTFNLHHRNELVQLLQSATFGSSSNNDVAHDFDLIVIGGGSGGLAASKEAAKLGKSVALLDFVKPSPLGTTWGIGGTCVNVGCIPKKMMHLAALVGQTLTDAASFGWLTQEKNEHDWNTLVQNVSDYIKSINWTYRVRLREEKVTYLNESAEFLDKNTIETIDKKGNKKTRTAKEFLIAVGGRPRYPDIPGAKEYAITSDDLFSLPYHPGKTLVVGASYISLESAGFLAGLGVNTTVMVRSILLRGFDQQIAEMIGDYMQEHGVTFQRNRVPISIEKVDGEPPGQTKYLVKSTDADGQNSYEEEFNTIMFAIGRDPCTKDLKLERVGVTVNEKTGKIIADERDLTSVPSIFAIGDCVENRPELTPAAIQAGLLLSKRLYGGESTLTDYVNCPTTVFTPIEYGCIGLSEEDAITKFGANDIEVYHSNFQAFENGLSKRDPNKCYSKLICVKSKNEQVVGFHYIGPNAGEITQGFALGMKFGATKSDFNSVIGIHPTSAENFTITLDITKSSGKDSMKPGCCG